MTSERESLDFNGLAGEIKAWGRDLGFDEVRITDTDLSAAEPGLLKWLGLNYHGEMDYMARHGVLRARPAELVPGTLRIVSVRMNYRAPSARDPWEVLGDTRLGYISRYALGRDYHKVIRARLQKLADRIVERVGAFHYRAFTDSAPLLEVELATKAGLGWRGKHTLLLNREAGSLFFLGELLTDLPLPVDDAEPGHCGRCTACLDACPTGAIVAPYELDARRCISYLTIEHKGSIPEPLRAAMGNRIYGCDDCQLVCPWNRFAKISVEPDFQVRHGLDGADLVDLFRWEKETFRERMQGSAIYRIGHVQWLRNLAVALGNAPTSAEVIAALRSRQDHPSDLVREHVAWALARHGGSAVAL